MSKETIEDTNVVQLPGTSRGVVPIEIAGIIPPDHVLVGAYEKLDEVIVVGIDKDGDLYIAANNPSFAGNTFLLQRAINKFVYFADEEVEIVHS